MRCARISFPARRAEPGSVRPEISKDMSRAAP